MEIDDNEYDLAINNRRSWLFALIGIILSAYTILHSIGII